VSLNRFCGLYYENGNFVCNVAWQWLEHWTCDSMVVSSIPSHHNISRLALDGWPSLCRHTTLVCKQPPKLTSLLPSAGQKMSTGQSVFIQCIWAQRQDGSFHSWISVWMAGKTVWSLVNKWHSKLFKNEYTHDNALYKCLVLDLLSLWSEVQT